MQQSGDDNDIMYKTFSGYVIKFLPITYVQFCLHTQMAVQIELEFSKSFIFIYTKWK